MSDREEFEKWYDEATNCNHGVAYYVGINDRYCFTDIEIAWQAWQSARANGTTVPMKRIAESKVRQLGGEVCGVLVCKDEQLAAVDEHGRVMWLDSWGEADGAQGAEVERILIQALADIESCAWGVPGYDTAEEAATWMNDRATTALSEACERNNAENGPTYMGEPVLPDRQYEQGLIGYTNASQLFYLSEEEGEGTIFAKKEEAGDIPVYTQPQPAQQGSVPESIAADDDVERVAKMAEREEWERLRDDLAELVLSGMEDCGYYPYETDANGIADSILSRYNLEPKP